MKRLPRILLVLFLALVIGACSGRPRKSKPGFPTEPITASSPQVQGRYDKALVALEGGRYVEATELFRLLQADYPDDPIAVLAELYIARANLGDLAVLSAEPITHTAAVDEALAILAGLAADDGVDDRVRWAAALYHAAGLASLGMNDEALSGLADYPGPSLSPALLERDRLAGQLLVAESLYRGGRWFDAVHAHASLFEGASGRGADEGQALLSLARSRGFEIALEHLEDDELQALLTEAESPFLRAVAGTALIQRGLEAEPSEEAQAALLDLHRRISPDLQAIGEEARNAEHAAALRGFGPARKLVIGALLPLSGKDQRVGQRALDGILLAQRAFEQGEEAQVTLVVEDSAGGADALHRLWEQGAMAVIGPLDADAAREAAVAAQEGGRPIVLLTPQQPSVARADDNWVFRLFLDARAEAEAAATMGRELGDARAVVLHPDIGYGRRMAGWFADRFQAEGGTVVASVEYPRDATDFSKQAGRVAALQPQIVYIPDTGGKVAEIAAFLAQQNVWGVAADVRPSPKAKRVQVHYLGTSLWQDPQLLRQASSYLQGALIPAWASPAFSSQRSSAFYGEFTRSFARRPDAMETFGYDAVGLLREMMLERGATTPGALREALLQPTAYRGVTGPVRFRADGEPARPLRFITVSEGDFADANRSVVTGVEDDADEETRLDSPAGEERADSRVAPTN